MTTSHTKAGGVLPLTQHHYSCMKQKRLEAWFCSSTQSIQPLMSLSVPACAHQTPSFIVTGHNKHASAGQNLLHKKPAARGIGVTMAGSMERLQRGKPIQTQSSTTVALYLTMSIGSCSHASTSMYGRQCLFAAVQVTF